MPPPTPRDIIGQIDVYEMLMGKALRGRVLLHLLDNVILLIRPLMFLMSSRFCLMPTNCKSLEIFERERDGQGAKVYQQLKVT